MKRGEDVDIRRALGTGNEESEREWESVVKELEEVDGVRERARRAEERVSKAREGGATEKIQQNTNGTEEKEKAEQRRPKFMM